MNNTSNDLVRQSRAGDEFHYVWAARCCLNLLDLNKTLTEISIEGASQESDNTIQSGENVIDIGEYHHNETDELTQIIYHQLKHSTVRVDKTFTLSELKTTLKGFSVRFKEFLDSKGEDFVKDKLRFSFISNRSINPNIKVTFRLLSEGNILEDEATVKKLIKHTELTFSQLQLFAICFNFNDSEKNYLSQRYSLRAELTPMLSNNIDNKLLDSLVAMVKDKALPYSGGNNSIKQEDVLQRMDIASINELFPAKPKLDTLENIIPREQEQDFLVQILDSDLPVVIHASGGVGKTIFAQSLCKKLPEHSLGIVFDCFAAGAYRNSSSPRHEHKQALVQISNELATKGLCQILLPMPNATYDQYIRHFREKLEQSVKKLQAIEKDAKIVVFIDAADNAEMAANEINDLCFANQLMQELPPEGIHIVLLCRTERKNLLKLQNIQYLDLNLKPFNKQETQQILNKKYNNISHQDIQEFHRLTNGNPRVQANAINQLDTLQEVLQYLGPNILAIDEQINQQLAKNLQAIKNNHPDNNIDLLCSALAILPPFIPIEVLSKITNISQSEIHSFATDMGRPIWVVENNLQFRDEPTETWFKQTFEATQEQLNSFIVSIKPLCEEDFYAAESLPVILLRANRYDDLIELALSNEHLPNNSPIDKRRVQVSRLKFALKAALKKKDWLNSTKLALRAGEETAGDKRQLELFAKNIDLLPKLQPLNKVYEIAFQQKLSGQWNGSNNIYTGSLLSHIKSFQGEARGYLRSAENWLSIYFEESDKHYQDKLTDEDLVELATSYFNIQGVSALVDFFSRWTPRELGFRIGRIIIERLVDHSEFEIIDKLAIAGQNNAYFILAIAGELAKVCRFLPMVCIKKSLATLTNQRTRASLQTGYIQSEQGHLPSYVAVAEAALFYNIKSTKINKLLNLYAPQNIPTSFEDDYSRTDRINFVKAHAIICDLQSQSIYIDKLITEHWSQREENSDYEKNKYEQEVKEIIGGLLPWVELRLKIIKSKNKIKELDTEITKAEECSAKATAGRYKQYDLLKYEIKIVRFEILTLSKANYESEITTFSNWINNDAIRFYEKLKFCRIAFRNNALESLREPLEKSCYEFIQDSADEQPEEISENYIKLARAIIPIQSDDARTCFDLALKVVSKFGDESLDRWAALNSLAKKASKEQEVAPSLVYRFTRCSEIVSNYNEKYFDWREAIKTIAQLSNTTAFSILSRLHDRDVSYFNDNIKALTEYLLKEKILSPEQAWALTPFFSAEYLINIADYCLEQTTNKQVFFDKLIKKTRLETKELHIWKSIKTLSEKHQVFNDEIDKVIDFNKKFIEPKQSNNPSHHDKEEYDYSNLLSGIDYSTSNIIDIVNNIFNKIEGSRSPNIFWKTVVANIAIGSEYQFIWSAVNSQKIDFLRLKNVFEQIPEDWWQKISIKNDKERIFQTICEQHCVSLLSATTSYNWAYRKEFFEEYNIAKEQIRKYVIQGIIDREIVFESQSLFSLVTNLSEMLDTTSAEQVFEYALNRFELFIDDEQAGGVWKEELLPPTNLTNSYTGMLWSALASPHSGVRWQAAHCVRELGELNCKNEIVSLINWFQRNKTPNAFIDSNLVFYKLHAQQYLLIVFARIAIDNPKILQPHSDFFKQTTLTSAHTLIRHFSAKTALLIEAEIPRTYDKNTLNNFKSINQTVLTNTNTDNASLHAGLVDENCSGIYFSWDFQKYWYESLVRIFGVSLQQLQDMASQIIIQDLHLNNNNRLNDTRDSQWQNNYEQIRHSHGSFPESDTLNFYSLYHAMFLTAGELLKSTPIIKRSYDWEDYGFDSWLSHYTLTLNDGRWLSDVRDYEPLQYRNWFNKEDSQGWQWQTTPQDFLEVLTNDDKSINIWGNFAYAMGRKKESISISSALIDSKKSMKVLKELQSYQNIYHYKISSSEDNDDKHMNKFGYGWISHNYQDNCFDEYDPYAEDVQYPPFEPAEFIQKQFNLQLDSTNRQWVNNKNEKCLVSETWSNGKEKDYGDCKSNGNRLKASLSFLKNMLTILKKELIIEVQINRKFCNSYMNKKRDVKYPEPYCQLFILSKKGVLRTTHRKHPI